MFTGIIRKIARVKSRPNVTFGRLEVANPKLSARVGDSIAVNGVCSTVVKAGRTLSFEYMPETLARSAIGKLTAGETVNLEVSLRATDRLDGHIVLGHVDTVGKIAAIHAEGNSKVLTIEPRGPKKFMKFVAEKGSVALDGVSLTVAAVGAKYFKVKLVPYTLTRTAFKSKKIGNLINIEFDILAKYLERLCK